MSRRCFAHLEIRASRPASTVIGYYVHHQGFGHLARAMSIGESLAEPVTLLTSRAVPEPHPFIDVVVLPRDDDGGDQREPTAHGALHWSPHLDKGYGTRMGAIAQWVRDAQPAAFVVDVSVEVAVLVRLLGVPVVVMAQPGTRIDAPHQLMHRMADQIIAPWPETLREPCWLRPYGSKTAYVGGISRFDGRPREGGEHKDVVVLGGADGLGVGQDQIEQSLTGPPALTWRSLGASGCDWVADPWPHLIGADVVVTHAGQNCIADVAVATRPAIVIAQPRPYDEQIDTADVLRRHHLAIVAPSWPARQRWPTLLAQARLLDAQRWRLWEAEGAAGRAAAVIHDVARRFRVRAAS